MNKNTIICFYLFMVSGCSITDPLVLQENERQDNKIYTTSAAVRTIHTKNPKTDPSTLCISPSPDASLDTNESINIELSLINWGKDSDSEQIGTDQNGLGGRAANVLITREIMYRLCEFYMNTDLTKAEKVRLFNDALTTVTEINKTNLGTGTETEATINTSVIEKLVGENSD